jgi:hypothetical protein
MMSIPLEWWRWREHPAETAFASLYAGLNLAYMVLGFAGFYLWRRHPRLSREAAGFRPDAFRELAYALAGSIILRSALLLTLDNSEPRYTLEFFPVLFVWAGALFASA